MTDDLDNKKVIKDVQATSDEAARLLASLESESKHEDSTLLRQKSVNKTKFASPATSIDAQPTADASGCIGAGILLLGLFIIIAFANYSQQTIGQSISTDKPSNGTIKPKGKMSTYQQGIYDKAFTSANNAVLKKEHKSAILSLERLKRSEYKNLDGVNLGLINNKIIQAKKKIKFLDQPGDDKYWEGADYGYQWFDEGANNQFRVFFAYSKKCANPLVTFAYRPANSSRSRNPVKTTNIRPKSYTSTILVPTYRGNSLWIDDFRCN